MTPEEIARRRLAAQHLVAAPAATPAEVVRRLGAVQAQDYAGAKWAIALRARSCVDAVVEQAMADGSIVRTHVLRPTWHFVAPAAPGVTRCPPTLVRPGETFRHSK